VSVTLDINFTTSLAETDLYPAAAWAMNIIFTLAR